MLPKSMLLHAVRNMASLDNALIRRAFEILRKTLPGGWVASPRLARPADPLVVDLVLRAPDGRKATICLSVVRRLTPRLALNYDMNAVKKDATLLIADYMSPATRERLRERGVGYIDLAGNVFLKVASPGLVIDVRGADVEPGRVDRVARSLRGPKAGRVVRVLSDLPSPIGVRALASAAGVDPGYASRLASFLADEALVDRAGRGEVVRVDRPGLLRRWAADAPMDRRGRTRRLLDPRGSPSLLVKLRDCGLRYAVTGSLAAARLAPTAAGRLAVVYVEDADSFAAALDLRPTTTGANVLLVEPIDSTPFERTEVDDGIVYVAPSQAAADLLSGPGRGPEEGEALLSSLAAPVAKHGG